MKEEYRKKKREEEKKKEKEEEEKAEKRREAQKVFDMWYVEFWIIVSTFNASIFMAIFFSTEYNNVL